MSNLTVTKSNDLNEASYRLSLDERRLILLCIAKIDSRGAVPDMLTVCAKEYGQMFDLQSNHAYEQIQKASDNLYDRDIKINNPERKERMRFRWVDAIKHYDGEGKVELSFSSKVKPYLGQLKSHFTSYRLDEIKRFKSGHAIRLYELLQQFKKTGIREISVQKFKQSYDIEAQYPKFAELRRRVIDPAVKEINQKSNIEVTWDPMKRGRTIHAIRFNFHEKSQRSLF